MRKIQKVFLCVFVALSMLLITSCASSQTGSSIPTEEKKQVVSYSTWPYYSFEDAVDTAATIVYGCVGEKGETRQIEGTSGEEADDYCRDVPIEALEVLKGEALNGTVAAIEPGGETADTLYIMEGACLYEEGQEYVLFLNEYGASLAPYAMMTVDDGIVDTSNGLLPGIDWIEEKDYPQSMPVEEYLDAIRREME